MVVEKIINPNIDWNEKITLELSLADLQLLYDCVGAVPWSYIVSRHEKTSFTIDNIRFSDLYNELEEVLNNHHGLIDYDDENNLNLNIELALENIN